MSMPPACPQCSMEHTYEDGDHYICPDCAHEWPTAAPEAADDDMRIVKDAHGNVLVDGDDVHLIKDLKVKGSSTILKKGAKARGIRIVAGDHEISCRVDGISYDLKAEFLKKA